MRRILCIVHCLLDHCWPRAHRRLRFGEHIRLRRRNFQWRPISSSLADCRLSPVADGSADNLLHTHADATPTYTQYPRPSSSRNVHDLSRRADATPARALETTPSTFDVPATLYYAQSGDTLPALAVRFAVDPSEIRAETAAAIRRALIIPGTLLVIPDRITSRPRPISSSFLTVNWCSRHGHELRH